MMALLPVTLFGIILVVLGLYFVRQGEAQDRERAKKGQSSTESHGHVQ